MASITKRGDKYKITITTYIPDGYDEKGNVLKKQKRICETYTPKVTTPKKAEKEAQDYAKMLEKRIRDGKYYDGEKLTFAEVVKLWDENWASIKDGKGIYINLTENVYEGYMNILHSTFLPTIGNEKINKINVGMLNSIMNDLRKSGKALGTIKRQFCVCRSVFKYACSQDIIENNPCTKLIFPKSTKPQIDDTEAPETFHCFNAQQARDFLNYLSQPHKSSYKAHTRIINGACYNVTGYEESHTIPTQYQAYFYLAIYGGCRRSELIALNWNDLDFDKRTIKIRKATTYTKQNGQYNKGTKTKAGNREIQLPKKCFDILKKWQLEEKEISLILGTAWEGFRGKDFEKNPVFIQLDSGKRMDVSTPTHKFSELLNYYNAEHSDNPLPIIRLHDLRHTSASLLVAEGVDIATISKRLGHSKISVTLDIYSHAYKEHDSEASDALDAII